MKVLKRLISFILIFTFTLLIVDKSFFIGSGQFNLAYCYDLEDDSESKENKEEIKKEAEKLCNSLINKNLFLSQKTANFHLSQNNSFAKGHPSQTDLPPEA